MDKLVLVNRALILSLLSVLGVWEIAGCRRSTAIDPVAAIKTGVRPAFQPPADGLLTDAQIETFLRTRRQAPSESGGEALSTAGSDAAELAWIRARVLEAKLVLDSQRVAADAADAYARALAVLREVRRSARDRKTAERLDAEISALERERASLRKGSALPPALIRNTARVAPRRAEIEAAGP
ncbi:MAG: hypothetical protein ABI968_00755 [Acidobacteriota bacterium]